MIDDLNSQSVKEDISFKELFYVIKSNVNKLIVVSSFFVLIAVIYLIVAKPVYEGTASIMIEDENSSVSSIFDMGLSSDKNHLDNEIQILKSRTTSERAIKALLDSDFKNDLFLLNTKKPNYYFLKNFLRNFFLLDRNIIIIEDIEKSIDNKLFNSFVKTLRNNISINNTRNTDLLIVSYLSNSSEEAALIVNTVIDVYQKRDQEWANGEMSHLKNFLNEQLEIKKIELDAVEQELKVFQENEHIYGLDDNSNLLLNQLTSIESDYYGNKSKKNILVERKKYFENELNNDEKEFANRVSNTLDVQLYSIRKELSILEADFISTKSREGDSHPAVIKLENKIKSLKKVLMNETKKYLGQGIIVANPIKYRQTIMDSVIGLDARISGYDYKLLELKKLVSKYEIQLSSLPEKYLKYTRFQRDKIILDETYSLMKQKFEEVKINEASQLGKIRIVDSAKPQQSKSSPNAKIIIIIALLCGFAFGIIFILFNEYIDSTIKSIEEIERRGLPLLGIIPAIGKEKNRRNKKKGYKINLKLNNSEKMERRLLTHEDPKSPISEAYRSLRTSLMFRDKQKSKGRIILVSSPGPGEGKTTTVANLAITYANMGKKTLLIDADLRKPVIHKMFKSNHNLGLTNYLSGSEKNTNNLIVDTDVNNLKVITSGIVPPNPSEMLASDYMDAFIEQITKDFDIILFDTPPLIAVTDAFVITKFVDKFLLVIRASVTQKGALERSIVNMKNMSHDIDGVIFNGVDETSTYGGGYYYNYYNYYYGSDEK